MSKLLLCTFAIPFHFHITVPFHIPIQRLETAANFNKSCQVIQFWSPENCCTVIRNPSGTSVFCNKRLLLLIISCASWYGFPNCIHSPAAFSRTREVHSYARRAFKLLCTELTFQGHLLHTLIWMIYSRLFWKLRLDAGLQLDFCNTRVSYYPQVL